MFLEIGPSIFACFSHHLFLKAISKIYVPIYPCLIISEGRQNCSTFWSAQQQNCDSGNMLPKINTCENWCWYFSQNLRIVALKLLKLTQFASQNLSIYLHFVWWEVVRCDVDIFKLTAHAQSINSESLCTLLC